MKVVGVRHSPEQRTIYSFIVPAYLENDIYEGSEVLCDTRRGEANGVVVEVIEGSREYVESALRCNGINLPEMRYIVKIVRSNRPRKFSIADNKSITDLLFG